ncbi:MAG: T9SS type A sorting domain-containing protein [Saprospiraceae bacterium]|nr:T9SS type A sorting domain-containing protein [Saprospiraceae bacterium]
MNCYPTLRLFLKTVLVLILILSNLPLFSQFQKNYGTPQDDSFSKVIQDGSNFYILGQNEPAQGGLQRAIVTCTDANGVVQWTLSLDIPSIWYDAVLTSNGDLLVVGGTLPFDATTKSLMGVINPSGNGSFSCLQSYDAPGRDFFYRVVENPSPENPAFPYYIIGSQHMPMGPFDISEDVVLFNVDANCNFNWKKIYTGAGEGEYFRDLEALPNGDLLFAGNNETLGFIFKSDNKGNAINGAQIPGLSFIDLGIKASGGIVAAANSLPAGNAHVLQFDQDLILQWDIIIPELSIIKQVWEGMGGKEIATGRGDFDGETRDIIIKILDNGPTIEWARYLDAGSNHNGGSSWLLANMNLAYTDNRILPDPFGGTCAFFSVSNLDLTNTCMVVEDQVSIIVADPLPDAPILPAVEFQDVPMGSTVTYSNIDFLEAEVCQNDTCAISLDIMLVDSCGHVQVNSIVTGPTPYSYQWCSGETTSNIDVQLACGSHTFCTTVTCGDGSTASASETINVTDSTFPTAICVAPFTVNLDTNCLYTLAVGMIDGGSFDNCQIDTMYVVPNTFNHCGIYSSTLVVVDWCGNVDSCNTTVTVEDIQAPTIICPPNIQVACVDETDPTNTGTATATDNCPGNLTISYMDTEFGSFPCDGVISRTWMVVDSCGNGATCLQNILVFDNVAPVLVNCNKDTSVQGSISPNGACEAGLTLSVPSFTDNCDTSITLINDFNFTSNASGVYPQGSTSVTWTATDDCNNSATCTFTVNVSCDTCACLGITDIAFLSPVTGLPDIPVACNGQMAVELPCIPNDALYAVEGFFACSSPSCNSSITYQYMTQDSQVLFSGSVNGGSLPGQFFVPGYAWQQFPGPGQYLLMITGICGNDTCKCTIPFILQDCFCSCGEFSDLSINAGPQSVSLSCGNMPEVVPCPPAGMPYVINGLFQCQGMNCPPFAPVNWMLTEPSGNIVMGSSPVLASPGFSLTFTQAEFSQPGVYCLKFTGQCGTQICDDCIIKFAIDCPPLDTCKCDNFELLYSVSRGPLLPVSCGDTLQVPTDLPFAFLSSLNCSPQGCDTAAFVDWILVDPKGVITQMNGVGAVPGFSIPLSPSTFATPGLYQLTLVGHCKSDNCECVVYFNSNGICCLDYDTFCQNIENNTFLVIDTANCKVTLDLKNLLSCDSIESIDWGDGHIDFGPFGAQSMPMHSYSGSGTYLIAWLAQEWDTNGFICFEKWIQDTITINCAGCRCGGFSNLYARGGPNYGHTPVSCGDTTPYVMGCPVQGYSYIFGNFNCADTSCYHLLEYEIFSITNNQVVGNGSYYGNTAYFIIGLAPYLSVSGDYELRLKGHCGTQECTCIIKFKVNCPNACPCDELGKDVGKGFSVKGKTSTCSRTFKPLGLCPNDLVSWTVNGSGIGSTSANNPVTFNFTNPGIYQVCMDVLRTDPITGLQCENQYCRSVYVKCGISPDPSITECPSNAIRNGDLIEGAVRGLLDQSGRLQDWNLFPNIGTGLVIVDDSSGGNDDVHLILEGSKSNFAGIWQEVDLMDAPDMEVGFAAINYNLDTMALGTALEFRLQEEPVLGSPSQVLFRVDLDKKGPTEKCPWINYQITARGITPDRDKRYLVICLQSNTDDKRSIIGLDNLEICSYLRTEVSDVPKHEAFKIFPNPGHSEVELRNLGEALGNGQVQLIDLLGKVLFSESLESGATSHHLSIGNLPPGVYFIQVKDGALIKWVSKFVKQ